MENNITLLASQTLLGYTIRAMIVSADIAHFLQLLTGSIFIAQVSGAGGYNAGAAAVVACAFV